MFHDEIEWMAVNSSSMQFLQDIVSMEVERYVKTPMSGLKFPLINEALMRSYHVGQYGEGDAKQDESEELR